MSRPLPTPSPAVSRALSPTSGIPAARTAAAKNVPAELPASAHDPHDAQRSLEQLQQRVDAAEERARSAQHLAQAAHRDSARLVRLLQVLAQPAASTAALLTRALETLSEAFDADVVCLVRGGPQLSDAAAGLPASDDAPAQSPELMVIASCGFPAGTSRVLPALPAALAVVGGEAAHSSCAVWTSSAEPCSSAGPSGAKDPDGSDRAGAELVVAGVSIRSAARLVLDPRNAAAGAVLLLRSDPTPLTPTELKLLQSVVERLHDGLAATERRHVAELLAHAGDRFTRHRQCTDLLADAVELLAALTGAEWAGIVAVEGQQAVLRAQGGSLGLDLSPAWPRQCEQLLGWDRLVQGGSHLVCDLALVPGHPDAPPRSQVRTVLSVPVMADGRVQVLLHALGRTPSAFSPIAREAVEQLSACLSAALVSSRLYAALERSEQELRHRATHDALTGLANRALFREELDRRLGLSGARHHDAADDPQTAGDSDRHAVGVIFCDLDDFKAVNDRLGHDAGDQLLRQASQRLSAAIRGGDLLARLGGDEFVVLLDPVPGVAEVHRVAERLLVALQEPVELLGQRGTSERVPISASLGGAVAGERGDQSISQGTGQGTMGGVGIQVAQQATELLCNADAAMYEAKRAGGRQVRVYDAAAASRAQRAAELAHDITTAVPRGQVQVAYQPVWDLIADTPVGVEALARWTHPVHGIVGPDVFIPQAERNGAIIGIGHQVLRTALADLRTWDAPGRAGLTVSVNASPLELADEGYADRVLGELAGAGVSPQRLLIEITEGLPLAGASLDQLARLRRSGVRVVVDDFGVSHSDLARLKHLRVDGLKIDKSLVDGLSTEQDANPMDVGIVSAVLALARTAGLSVVAEGVESPAQRAALVALGCSLAQGWLMSKPLPAAQLQDLLARS